MNKIGIFYENPFRAGGTETWILNICKVYGKKYDITVYYPDDLNFGENIPEGAYDRLSSLVNVIPISNEIIDVDVALFAFDYFHIDLVNANKKYLFIHPGDGHGNHPRTVDDYSQFDGVIGVSKYTVDKMSKWCPGLDVQLVYNPVPEKELKLISLSRSAKDKGWGRVIKLANKLHERGIKFTWDVYTDYQGVNDCEYINFRKPTIDTESKLRNSDFLVQLSDYESFGYSMVEGMQYSKLIVTDIEILPEMGINKGNAVIVPLINTDYDLVVDDILSRCYVPPQTDYKVLFGEPDDNINQNRIKIHNNLNMDLYIEDQNRWLSEYETTFVYKTDSISEMIKSKHISKIK